MRVNVYDYMNRDRLLGSVEVPERLVGSADHYTMAIGPMTFPTGPVREQCDPCGPDPAPAEVAVRTVRFDLEVCRRGTWAAEVNLLTTAPLTDLMDLPRFLLPGETLGAMSRRHAYLRG